MSHKRPRTGTGVGADSQAFAIEAPSMPPIRRRRYAAKRVTYKRRGQRGIIRATGVPRMARLTDVSVVTMNTGKQHMIRRAALNQAVTAQFSNATPTAAYIFDPSGTYGNTATGGGPLGITDWASCAALWSQYKVTKITCNFTYESEGAKLGPWTCFFNKNFERLVTAPTVPGMLQLDGTQKKIFSPEHGEYTLTFVPKVNVFADNAAVIASEGLTVQDMPWCDVTAPPQLYGLQLASNYTLATTQFLFMEITYEIAFRYAK